MPTITTGGTRPVDWPSRVLSAGDDPAALRALLGEALAQISRLQQELSNSMPITGGNPMRSTYRTSSGDVTYGPRLQALIDAAKARYDAMTPAEREAHDKAQRESFVRGMMPTGDPKFD